MGRDQKGRCKPPGNPSDKREVESSHECQRRGLAIRNSRPVLDPQRVLSRRLRLLPVPLWSLKAALYLLKAHVPNSRSLVHIQDGKNRKRQASKVTSGVFISIFPSVSPSVHPSIHPSIHPSARFRKAEGKLLVNFYDPQPLASVTHWFLTTVVSIMWPRTADVHNADPESPKKYSIILNIPF